MFGDFLRKSVVTFGGIIAIGTAASATTLPGIGDYVGNAGFGVANGDVGVPPLAGVPLPGADYVYVTTDDGDPLLTGLGLGSESGGSELTTFAFSALAGTELSYFFNFVTSDGGDFADYAYVQLLNAADDSVAATLLTARTVAMGDVVPGFGMPAISAGVTLTPATSGILPGTTWSELGVESGTCFDTGCGHTDWIETSFTIDTAGDYKFRFGVMNWQDNSYDSGLAIAGFNLSRPAPAPVPLPAGGALLASALGVIAFMRRRRK